MRATAKTISPQTLAFIECIEQLNALYDGVSQSLTNMYGDMQSEAIMENEFYEHYHSLMSVLDGFLARSVHDNLSTIGSTEI